MVSLKPGSYKQLEKGTLIYIVALGFFAFQTSEISYFLFPILLPAWNEVLGPPAVQPVGIQHLYLHESVTVVLPRSWTRWYFLVTHTYAVPLNIYDLNCSTAFASLCPSGDSNQQMPKTKIWFYLIKAKATGLNVKSYSYWKHSYITMEFFKKLLWRN